MRTIDCNTFLDYLERRMEGDRDADAEAHHRYCRQCQSLVQDLEAIRVSARELGEEAMEAPARVWTSLHAQLVQEGLIRQPGFGQKAAAWLGEMHIAFPRPVLAGAYLVLMVAGGLALGWYHSSSSSNSADSRWYNGTRADLAGFSSALASAEPASYGGDDPNPVVAASLHRNLALVDNYIKLCEESVREEPQNEMAREYLYDAYQQKAELLSEISERGVGGR